MKDVHRLWKRRDVQNAMFYRAVNSRPRISCRDRPIQNGAARRIYKILYEQPGAGRLLTIDLDLAHRGIVLLLEQTSCCIVCDIPAGDEHVPVSLTNGLEANASCLDRLTITAPQSTNC